MCKINQYEIKYLLNKEKITEKEKKYRLNDVINNNSDVVEIERFLRILGKKINYFLNYKDNNKEIVFKNKIVFNYKDEILTIKGFGDIKLNNKDNSIILFEGYDKEIKIKITGNKKEKLSLIKALFYLIADFKKNKENFKKFYGYRRKAMVVSQIYNGFNGLCFYSIKQSKVQLFLKDDNGIEII